jgi:hypothetical protein
MGLEFGFELFVGFDTLGGVATGFDQCFSVGTLAFMTFTQGFKNIHGVSSSAAFWIDAL